MIEMAIIDHWNLLNEEQKIEFRDSVLKATGISYPSFYNKIKKNSFSRCETIVILQLIKEEYVREN